MFIVRRYNAEIEGAITDSEIISQVTEKSDNLTHVHRDGRRHA